MVSGLVGLIITVAVVIIAATAVFGMMPGLMESQNCPDPANFTDVGASAWAESCTTFKENTIVVPTIITVGLVLGVLIAVFKGAFGTLG